MAYNYPFYSIPYMSGYQPQQMAQPQMPMQYPNNAQQMQPQMPSNQMQGYQQNTSQVQSIPGQMVDSIDAARAKDIDMSGTPRYYPNINGQEVYMKQLQPDGTCPTVIFRRVISEPPVQPHAQEKDLYADAFGKVFAELDAIKAMISEPVKRTGKAEGGAKA